MDNLDHVPINLSEDSFFSKDGCVLYYCIPKVASRSILNLCQATFVDGYLFGEKQFSKEQFFSSMKQRPFRFTFVRDPIERVLSFYFDKCVNYDGSEGKKLLFGRYQHLNFNIRLKDFIDWLKTDEGSDQKADHHFCSQHLFIYSQYWKNCADYVGYIQTIDQDIAHIWSRLGRDVPVLQHLNSNTDSHIRKTVYQSADYLKYLDASDILKLQKRYEADYDLFNF